MDWTIVPLHDDLDAATALLNGALGAGTYTSASLASELTRQDQRWFAARDREGTLLGAACARMLEADDLPFYDVFPGAGRRLHGRRVGSLRASAVAEALRGRGLGSALARERLAWLRAQGAEVVIGLSWQSGQPHTSRPVFERLGFDCAGRSDDLYTHLSLEHGFHCPTCGHPCRCPALLFVRELDAGPA